MKKSILNIGKVLNKSQQQKINGGMTDCSIASVCEGCGGFAGPGGTCFGGQMTWWCCNN
jgi:hypothetical protein